MGEYYRAKLGHPKLDIPDVRFDSTGKASTGEPLDANSPSAKAWIAYIATRESWRKEKFAKAFPKESAYRHSVQEEAEALRAVIKVAEESKSANPQLQLLTKLDKEGLLEAFILMGLPDDGIAADHAEFLKNNRPKLRQYVANYVISK